MVLSSVIRQPERRAMTVHAIRYAVAGLLITIAFSACYWAGAELLRVDPNVALALVFVLFSIISFVAHGRFSFAGHGERDRPHVRLTRFFIVNILGFLANQFFVWLLVKKLDGATWWPIIPFVFVTPWLTFVLHRRWVYA